MKSTAQKLNATNVPQANHNTPTTMLETKSPTPNNLTTIRKRRCFVGSAHHQLTAGKLLCILDKSGPVLKADDLDVDVEHEAPFISQFPITAVEPEAGALVLRLGTKHTACLAEDEQ